MPVSKVHLILPKSYYSYRVEEEDNAMVSSKKWKSCLNKEIRKEYNFLQVQCKPIATQTKIVGGVTHKTDRKL